MNEIPMPDLVRQQEFTRSVPDHEIVLSFGYDDHAEKFADWLSEAGWAAFGAWARSQPGRAVASEEPDRETIP